MTTIAQQPDLRVIGGVDTHKDIHVAAVIDELGRFIAAESFRPPPTATGDCSPGAGAGSPQAPASASQRGAPSE